MPMPPYPVLCYARCGHPAAFKVAAAWSDGTTRELKTYSLACAACLPRLFADALGRRDRCRLAPGETLAEAAVYDLTRGVRDPALARRPDLESLG